MTSQMKRITFSLIVLFIIAGATFWLMNQDTSDEGNENNHNEQAIEASSNNNEETDTENSNNNEKKRLTDPIDILEYEGEECLALEDTIERGDCLQELGEENINWYMNEEKDEFYFPYQREQDHWQYLFYQDIEDDDKLGSIQEGDDYDEDRVLSLSKGESVLEEFWHVFAHLIPKEEREHLTAVYWVDTGEDLVLAVGNEDPDSMYLLFSDLIPSYNPYIRYHLLHEYGHILTLNSSQVDVHEDLFEVDDEDELDKILKETMDNCETIYANGRCMKEDSYIYDYYNRFWDDIYDEHAEIDWENEEEYKDFFLKYEDHFFNSYQGTSFVEDIADAFTFFVHSHSSVAEGSDIKHEKLKFFYEFDEFVELRTVILENLRELIIKDDKIY